MPPIVAVCPRHPVIPPRARGARGGHHIRRGPSRRENCMKIAVLTAGGVAPGMNAAVRAVAQKAFSLGWEVVGVEDGFGGILEERFSPIDRSRLGGLMHRGGRHSGWRRRASVGWWL